VAGTSDAFGGPHPIALQREGAIVDALAAAAPRAGLAGWINDLPLTARLYEPLWRHRSLALITRGAFDTRRELATLERWLALTPGEMVLDVGCSAGLYALTLARAGAQLHAIDRSRAFLREAARNAERAGLAITLVRADAHALPYRDASFDAVAIGATANEFADPARAWREIARVLRPGGRLFCMAAYRSRGIGGWLQTLLHLAGLRFPTSDALDAVAAAAGLTLQRREERSGILLALYRRDG
jgi:SAM-dependent methyltransferase